MAIGIGSSYKESSDTSYILLDSKEEIVEAYKRLSFKDKRFVEIAISKEKLFFRVHHPDNLGLWYNKDGAFTREIDKLNLACKDLEMDPNPDCAGDFSPAQILWIIYSTGSHVKKSKDLKKRVTEPVYSKLVNTNFMTSINISYLKKKVLFLLHKLN
jgi:hypothetical protein